MQELNFVFDGPPGNPNPRLIDIKDSEGHSVSAGSWNGNGDGTWTLTMMAVPTQPVPEPREPSEEELARLDEIINESVD